MTSVFTGYSAKSIDELPELWDGFARLVRAGLDITAFGAQIMELPRDYATESHDEADTGAVRRARGAAPSSSATSGCRSIPSTWCGSTPGPAESSPAAPTACASCASEPSPAVPTNRRHGPPGRPAAVTNGRSAVVAMLRARARSNAPRARTRSGPEGGVVREACRAGKLPAQPDGSAEPGQRSLARSQLVAVEMPSERETPVA